MGKIYKNPNPEPSKKPAKSVQTPVQTTVQAPQETSITPVTTIIPKFILPQAKVIPLEHFDKFLEMATQLVQDSEFTKALDYLVNLEITNFDNIEVHELLADVFLQLNQLTLAKEQCQICAELLSKSNPNDIFTLKTFEDVLADAGNFEELTEEFEHIKTEEVTNDNFHHGTNVALKLATHHLSQERYQEAESLLIDFREKYIKFLENSESLENSDS